jgi:hypothetical protein
MRSSIEDVFRRFHPLAAATLAHDAVVIRAARDADLAALHDLAELDSAVPLTGDVLVAIVDGRPWAAIGVDDGRVIADPFRASGAAVELLRLRVAQLRTARGRGRGWRAGRGRSALWRLDGARCPNARERRASRRLGSSARGLS